MKNSILVWLGIVAMALGKTNGPYDVSVQMDSYDTGRIVHIRNNETNVNFLVFLDENGNIPLSSDCRMPEIRFLATVPKREHVLTLARINNQWRRYPLKPVRFIVSDTEKATNVIQLIPFIDKGVTNHAITVESSAEPKEVDIPEHQLKGTFCIHGSNVVCRLWNIGAQPAIVQYVPFRPRQNGFLLSPNLSVLGTTEDGEYVTFPTPCGPNGIIDDVGPTYYSVLPARSQNEMSPVFVEWDSPLRFDLSAIQLIRCEARVWVPCLEVFSPRREENACSLLRTVHDVELETDNNHPLKRNTDGNTTP